MTFDAGFWAAAIVTGLVLAPLFPALIMAFKQWCRDMWFALRS